MKHNRILSFVLCLMTLMTVFPEAQIKAAGNQGERNVYIHAQGTDNPTETKYSSTVYMGDTANVYFAINDPNRGDYIARGSEREHEIADKLASATAGVVEEYKQKVISDSKAASALAFDMIEKWYRETDEDKKAELRRGLEQARFYQFLTRPLENINRFDFNENGEFEPVNLFEAYDGNDYDFDYRYEYEFFYIDKIDAAQEEILNAIREHNNAVSVAKTTEEKEELKHKLVSKYSTNVVFAEDFSAEINNRREYRKFVRESLHNDRILPDGKYYVGRDAEEAVRHREPQYDLNGYTVRIYYDTDYFELIDSELPLKYNTPGQHTVYTTDSKEEQIEGEIEDAPIEGGLWAYEYGKLPEEDGYASVYATVFANGIYFPNKQDTQEWYNLCYLPLKPKKTGRTQVSVQLYTTGGKLYPLELLAKHDPSIEGDEDDSYNPTFKLNIENGGVHTINIMEKGMPEVPKANKGSGTYREKVDVKLTADKDCTIYYRYEGETIKHRYSYPDPDSDRVVVDEGISIDYTRSFVCWSERTEGLSDSEKANPPKSNEVTYSYTIVPDTPYLWESSTVQIISQCYKKDAFKVFPSDRNDAYKGEIDDIREIFYTYNDKLTYADVPETAQIGEGNPQNEWVKLTNNKPELLVNKNQTLRMIARKNDIFSNIPVFSDIAEFKLGIKPDAVYDPLYDENGRYNISHEIELVTDNSYPVDIYYTTDGSDPITEGILYNDNIMLMKDTVVRAVAVIPGTDMYSDVSVFKYIFDTVESDIVNAFYPEGTYDGKINVALTANNHAYRIEYFIKNEAGYVPTDSDFVPYNGEKLEIDRNKTVYARVIYPDGTKSGIYDYDYIIKPQAPHFLPKSTQFVDFGKVNISAVEQDTALIDYKIYYTTDGSDPTDESNPNRALVEDSPQGYEPDHGSITVDKNVTIKAAVYASYGEYSSVSVNTYRVISGKPIAPVATLKSGYYTLSNSDTEGFLTKFLTPPEGTEIYYTISRDGEGIASPYPGEEGTYAYNSENPIPIDVYGKTVIKAVAIDEDGNRSDIGVFTYVVMPEAPIAAPSTVMPELTAIPVTVVPGAEVTYTITDESGVPYTITVALPQDSGKFYINPDDGLPYSDEQCTIKLTEETGKAFDGTIILDVLAELENVTSGTNTYVYTVDGHFSALVPPYADKPQGVYDEISRDAQDNLLLVKLYKRDNRADTTIQYRTSNSGWTDYVSGEYVPINGYTILQIRTKDTNDNYSDVASYVYSFKPLPPVFTKDAGVYADKFNSHIELDDRHPDNITYQILWKVIKEGYEHPEYVPYTMPYFEVDTTMYARAYVRNTETGEISEVSGADYVIAENNNRSFVQVKAPYNVSSVNTNVLATGEFAEGIKLELLTGSFNTHYIEYQYSYVNRDTGLSYNTSWNKYDPNMPVMVNSAMKNITIKARVYKNDGTLVSTEVYTHSIEFIKDAVINPGGNGGGNSGGGGGGGSIGSVIKHVDNTRKYTKDIFGVEHPTHIGYINGYTDGTVRPQGQITRQEIAAILYRVKNKQYDKPFNTTGRVFPDVAGNHWAATPIEYMADDGVIVGYPDGGYKPEKNLTRAEFAALICRFSKLQNVKLDSATRVAPAEMLSEIDGHWAYDYIITMYNEGLINGYEDNTFRPEQQITRAEVVTVMNRILGRKPLESYVKSLGYNPFSDLYENEWYYVAVLEATITHDYYLNESGYEYKWENTK